MKQAMPSSVMKECLGIVDSVTQSIQTVNTAAQRSLASNTWSHDQKYHTEKLHVFSMFLMLACILRYSQDMGWTCLKHELKAEWGGLPWVWSQLGHIASFRLAWATDRDFCIKKQQENRSHPSMGKIRHERDADLTFSHHAGEWWKVREVEIQLGFPALAKSLYMKLWRQEDKQDVIQKFSKLNLSPFYTKGRSGASPVVIHAASWLCPYYSESALDSIAIRGMVLWVRDSQSQLDMLTTPPFRPIPLALLKWDPGSSSVILSMSVSMRMQGWEP